MTVNCVMLVRDRPELTRQALETLLAGAEAAPNPDAVRGVTAEPGAALNLVIVDDGSTVQTACLVESFSSARSDVASLRLNPGRNIVGLARNLGILASERIFGRGDFLYLADNDGFYCPSWLETLTGALTIAESDGIRLLGGCNHPFHAANTRRYLDDRVTIGTHNAVAGLSHLMRWETYDRFGPFDANAKGIGQSEDFAFCRRIVEAGFLVGSVYPRVILNCGLVDSYGKPCIGYEAVKSELLGEIKARGLEGKVWFPEVSTHDPVKSLKMPNW